MQYIYRGQFLILILISIFTQAQNASDFQWHQRAHFPLGGEPNISFSIGNYGYWGFGANGLWRYSPEADTWTQMQDLPLPTSGMPAFTINDEAYYMPISNNQIFVYKYDLNSDTWSEVALFPGQIRGASFVFSISDKAYMCMGINGAGEHLSDVWEFDSNTNLFTQKNNFPFQNRWGGSYFSINGKGYVGMGNLNWNFVDPNGKDLYEYDPLTDTWTQKASLPAPQGRYATAGFSINSYGYVLCGEGTNPLVNYDEFWRYNPADDSWTLMPGYGAGGQNYLKSFVIGDVCYAGKGMLWSFDADCGNIAAKITHDVNTNCLDDPNELRLEGFPIIMNPGNLVLTTNVIGEVDLCGLNIPDGTYTLTIDGTFDNWEASCTADASILIQNGSVVSPASFYYFNTNPCPSPDISITCPTIRRCSEHTWPVYVYACNDNLGTGILENAYVQVELDENIIVDSATTPPFTMVNGLYQFEIGNLNPGQCTTIVINANFSCDLEIGETLCMEATLYPVPECTEIEGPGPGECTEPWDHSSLEVEGECDEDTGTITFTIENDGEAMVCSSEVRVYVDGELFETHYIQLGAESDTTFTYPTNGGTWILQADQHPLHPGNSHPNDHVEGCGDVEGEGDGDDDDDDGDDDDDDEWEPGLVDDLPCGDESPFVDVYCGEVVGSFDPNDKQGFPNGVGETHDVLPNEQLQYLIRFQNTGTAPAYTVVIRDTLDTDLDIFSVTPGVASHDYSFTMYGERVLQWTFNNIMLADSFSNEEASHGFITYTVNQVADLANGTEITNSAAIYFDSNEPVITNTTLHTINYCLFKDTYSTVDVTDTGVYTAPDGAQYDASGTYTAVITNAVGCDSTITIHLTLGLNELTARSIQLFPIPASQTVTAVWDGDNTPFEISSPDGRVVLTGRLITGNNTIDISTLATGNYFLKADNRVTRFVVK
jgi:uncharacterized repeat protein (TIGR01451 family)